jgi:hypothetical protein
MNKEAVKRTLDRINGIDAQRQFLVQLCHTLVKEELPEELRDTIVNDVDVHFYDKNTALHNAYTQGTQVTLLPTSIVSNFNYAMTHLLPRHYCVFFVHAKVDKVECAFSVVFKEYSKDVVYEIMIDHSNGFHKQFPYQLYKHVYKSMFTEIKKIELFPENTIEKIGWLSKKQVLSSCRQKMEPLLLNTPFSDRLRKHGQVFFQRNKKEDATGKVKKSFHNVLKGIRKNDTIYVGAIIHREAIPHAWLVVNKENDVLELTPRNEGLQVYYGVPVSLKKYKRWYATNPNVFDVCISEF